MIKHEGDYYVCEGSSQEQNAQVKLNQSQGESLQATGDIKYRIQAIKKRVQDLKKQKEEQTKQQAYLRLSEVFTEASSQGQDYSINIYIPQQVLKLQQRLERIESRLQSNEIQRQKIDKNLSIVQRVKKLSKKLQDMIKNKSIEIIAQNIMQFSGNIEQKQDNLKQMYLYEVFTKTQGLKEEMNILQQYLQNLSNIQRTTNGTLPINATIAIHNEILQRKKGLRSKIESLFKRMKTQYSTLLSQIDAIEV